MNTASTRGRWWWCFGFLGEWFKAPSISFLLGVGVMGEDFGDYGELGLSVVTWIGWIRLDRFCDVGMTISGPMRERPCIWVLGLEISSWAKDWFLFIWVREFRFGPISSLVSSTAGPRHLGLSNWLNSEGVIKLVVREWADNLSLVQIVRLRCHSQPEPEQSAWRTRLVLWHVMPHEPL